jgi:hypothetical protein
MMWIDRLSSSSGGKNITGKAFLDDINLLLTVDDPNLWGDV